MQTLGMLHNRRLVLNSILLATGGTVIGILVATALVSTTLGWLTLIVGLVVALSIAHNQRRGVFPDKTLQMGTYGLSARATNNVPQEENIEFIGHTPPLSFHE